jgi:hypothetical protein
MNKSDVFKINTILLGITPWGKTPASTKSVLPKSFTIRFRNRCSLKFYCTKEEHDIGQIPICNFNILNAY